MTLSFRFLVPALGIALLAGPAFGQTTWKATCTNIGPHASEPLGPEGHALAIAAATCVVDGGPLNGAVVTQNATWEAVKGKSTLLSGDGVARKPGGTAAYRLTAATLTPVIQDGKPVGWTAAGTGVFTLGVGEGAVLKGKAFSWASRMTGPRQYVTDNKID